MKQYRNAHPRAAVLLMATVALPFTPALGQETAPPPIAATTAPAPAATTPVAPTAPVFAAPAPIVQNVPPPGPSPTAAAEARAPEALRPAVQRAVPRTAARSPAKQVPVEAVAPPTRPAPVTPAPLTDVVPPSAPAALAENPQPSPVAQPTAAQEASRADTNAGRVPWLPIAIAALAAILIGAFAARRRGTVASDNPAPAVREPKVQALREPSPSPVPVNAARRDERPWVGLSFAPIRAGTDGDDTLVQYELTVENASDMAAHDVRVSSFLIDGAHSSNNERSLISTVGEPQSQTVDIMPNGRVPITSTIHVDRKELSGDSFSPKVVAEVRYPLPDGGEGVFSARFSMGIADGEDITSVSLSDGMHDNVGAKLDDVLEQA